MDSGLTAAIKDNSFGLDWQPEMNDQARERVATGPCSFFRRGAAAATTVLAACAGRDALAQSGNPHRLPNLHHGENAKQFEAIQTHENAHIHRVDGGVGAAGSAAVAGGSGAGRTNRRGWLRGLGAYASGAAAAAVLGGSMTPKARAQATGGPTPGEIAVLQFLAAAEQIETDLWQQYTELAEENPAFMAALSEIDPSLIQYINDDRDDELSHANLINAYLVSVGAKPVDLNPFKTLPSSRATGAEQVGRITNLTSLDVDTSWYNRYRGPGNPDFGDAFPQLVDIVGRPTIPTSNRMRPHEYRAAAHCAAFHFCAIEQGGGSLYCDLLGKVHTPDVVAILGSIGPVEVYHFATFHKSLEGLTGLDAGGGLVFPNLRADPGLARLVMPEPCTFLSPNLPLCSVIRPRSTAKAGAVAAATGLIGSGLFNGQSQAFFNAVAALAAAADNA